MGPHTRGIFGISLAQKVEVVCRVIKGRFLKSSWRSNDIEASLIQAGTKIEKWKTGIPSMKVYPLDDFLPLIST